MTVEQTPTPESTPSPDPTGTPEPDADIQFPSCNTVEVTAESYSSVGLALPNEETEVYDGEYTGTETFGADTTVQGVVVWTQYGKVDQVNPSLESCMATPTPGPGTYDVERVKGDASEPTREEMFRDIEEYRGEAVRIEWAQVDQAFYEDDYDYFRLFVSQNDEQLEGDIFAWYYGATRYIEGDMFNPIWGVVEELTEYETIHGETRTIPAITLVDVDLDEE